MSSSFYFKHTWTGVYVNIDLNLEIYLCDLRTNINSIIIHNLNVNDYDIVESGKNGSELANKIDESHNIKLHSFINKAFYIRPIHEPIPERILTNINNSNYIINCNICYHNCVRQNINAWECSHHLNFCNGCINNWINSCLNSNTIATCPMCRNNI